MFSQTFKELKYLFILSARVHLVFVLSFGCQTDEYYYSTVNIN